MTDPPSVASHHQKSENGSDSIDGGQPEFLAQMETVLDVLNEGVVVTDARHRILVANSRFREMIGTEPHALCNSRPTHFYSEQEWAFLMQQAELTFRAGRNRYAFVLARQDGIRLPVIISSRILENSTGQFGIVTFTDISEQVKAEQELRAANARLQERQKEIEEDLRLAARVQNSLTPKSLIWEKLSVDAFYHPVRSIGGDFAVVNSPDGEHVNLLVCDVSGHGIGSALVANRIYSEAAVHLKNGTSFTDLFIELNRLLIDDIAGSGLYVTAAAVRIHAAQRRMFFSGAGHPPVMLARRGCNPMLLESRSMILGAFGEAVDTTGSLEVELETDDRVVIYTDGITEVFDARGEMLGTEGLGEVVRQCSALPAHAMKQAILNGVAAWRNGSPTDDVSLVVAHIR